jgi:hypothetical protein
MTRVWHGWQPLEGPGPGPGSGPGPGLRLCRRLRWALVCSVAIFTHLGQAVTDESSVHTPPTRIAGAARSPAFVGYLSDHV